MLLATAKNHFTQDIQRSNDLVTHAATIPEGMLQSDIYRASWMMAVGACDAYFCDAYTDLISRALRAKDLEPAIEIPDRLNNLRVPVTAILRQAHGGWRWRMAARELMEDENVLSLDKVRALFNHFFRKTHKLLNQDTIEPWIIHRSARSRMFGITATQYRAMAPQDRSKARKEAIERFEEHFSEIFQRRHDCIHNCDRPKIALQPVSAGKVIKVIADVEFLVSRCHEALVGEFPEYMRGLGFGAVTRNQVLQ